MVDSGDGQAQDVKVIPQQQQFFLNRGALPKANSYHLGAAMCFFRVGSFLP